ncbi:hypothetical protein [Bacillus thuringiensis]|uniref:hypothetical protein n=1 Tax=Bacillus thuringiensis TaxID=1428 RepID=UPI000BF3391B|nr:hypothetical protein [Bacillus thuringiensis]PFN47091.1 hypothetical protein COJ75_30125 [Bacillus thuringiensis]
MKMKKQVVSMALLGMMAVGGGTNAFAAEGDYQTINNGSGIDIKTSAEIKAKGVIGEADNTDPGESLPEGDDKWINVTLPTDVVFNSDENNEHKTIVSPDNYKITNNSGRPVQVSLENFEGVKEGTALQTLNLAPKVDGDFESKELIKDKKITASPSELVKLANKDGEMTGNVNAKKEVSFKFTGNVDKTALGEKKENVEYNMTLKFKALKMDGSEV